MEIRWHARGGQGAVVASELLAEAAMNEGQYFQAFPDYGAERAGAPVRVYTRISDQCILEHSPISEPDVIVVLDITLFDLLDVTEGLKRDGALIVNTDKSPQEIREISKLEQTVYVVNATRIALNILGRNIPNTSMIGAIIKATGVVNIENAIRAVSERLAARLGKSIGEKNAKAMERAYVETKRG